MSDGPDTTARRGSDARRKVTAGTGSRFDERSRASVRVIVDELLNYGRDGADRSLVPELTHEWLTVAQSLAAGLVIGLCTLHWGWWRGDVHRAGVRWTVLWSAVLASVCLVDAVLAMASTGPAVQVLMTFRFITLAAAVTVALPAVHAFTRGPGVRLLVATCVTWYATATVLWVATDLVHEHRTIDVVPQYGPYATAVHLLPLAVVVLYVARGVRGHRLTVVGAVLTVSGFTSCALLVTASVPPPSELTEALQGVWVLPLLVGLQVFAASRIAEVRRDALRRGRMRDALATLTNAAWLVGDAKDLLDQARDEARTVLGDPSIEGSLRRLGKDRFVTEFYSPGGRPVDDDERQFLQDLARVVSASAERRALTSRLERAASTDSLTQLPNRRALDRHLARALTRAVEAGSGLAVVLCDLTGFTQANDRHGHAWGDRLLVHTAEHLRAAVGDSCFVARQGPDEFVIVLEDVPDAMAAMALAHHLRVEFRLPGPTYPGAPALGVGVATWAPGDALDAGTLLTRAELAVREAERGHTGVARYDARLQERVDAQSTLRRALETGITSGDIVAYFQPLTDTGTLDVVGLEVLARWRRDGRTCLPGEWLPFAEESGLITAVGTEMFRAARLGMERFGLPVAVNVAARQLDEPDFIDQVERAWGVDGWDRLTIEVTESALLYDAVRVRHSLDALARRGVRIAIDDFGTGYNSLSRLGELPLHILKIDRTFVQDIDSPAGAAVIRAIYELARAHGLEVVAEGVERPEELEALVALGVDVVQGHMLGHPAEAPTAGGTWTTTQLARETWARSSRAVTRELTPSASA